MRDLGLRVDALVERKGGAKCRGVCFRAGVSAERLALAFDQCRVTRELAIVQPIQD